MDDHFDAVHEGEHLVVVLEVGLPEPLGLLVVGRGAAVGDHLVVGHEALLEEQPDAASGPRDQDLSLGISHDPMVSCLVKG